MRPLCGIEKMTRPLTSGILDSATHSDLIGAITENHISDMHQHTIDAAGNLKGPAMQHMCMAPFHNRTTDPPPSPRDRPRSPTSPTLTHTVHPIRLQPHESKVLH